MWTRYATVLVAGLAVVSGCSSAERIPELHTFTGTISRGGNPVAGGGLIFLPSPPNGSGLVVNAAVKAGGTFSVETSRTTDRGTEILPGAPAGTYRVVYHPPSNGQKTGLDVELTDRVTVAGGAAPVALTLPPAIPDGNGVPRDDDPDTKQ